MDFRVVAECLNLFHKLRTKEKLHNCFLRGGGVIFPRRHSFCACVSRKSSHQPTQLPQRLTRDWKNFCFQKKKNPPQVSCYRLRSVKNTATASQKRRCISPLLDHFHRDHPSSRTRQTAMSSLTRHVNTRPHETTSHVNS